MKRSKASIAYSRVRNAAHGMLERCETPLPDSAGERLDMVADLDNDIESLQRLIGDLETCIHEGDNA